MSKDLVVRFAEHEKKKHSVKYKSQSEDVSMSIYVPKSLLKDLGNPSELIVTFSVPDA